MVRGIPITGILITRKNIPALAFLAADSKQVKKELFTDLSVGNSFFLHVPLLMNWNDF